jgi:hypothetical protein
MHLRIGNGQEISATPDDGKTMIRFQLMSCVELSGSDTAENVSIVNRHGMKTIRVWTSMLPISAKG